MSRAGGSFDMCQLKSVVPKMVLPSQRTPKRQRQHLLTILLLLHVLTNTAVPCHAFDEAAISKVLSDLQTCRASTTVGMAVTIVKDGQVLLSRGYGVTVPEGKESVTSQTRFGVASLSKAFTATLLLKVMEEDGRYNLSTKVREVLGDDLQFADQVRTQEATVEDLLSHKMAIPANNKIRLDANLTRASLKDRLKDLKSPDGFRNVFIYSNLMYGLAMRMTEVIGKGRWGDLVSRHLFEPLGMSRSTFSRAALQESTGRAHPYINYFGTWKPVSPRLISQWSELGGSGSVVTTAEDMAKWMNFHLSKGQGPDGKSVVAEKTMEKLYKPRTALKRSPMTSFRQPDVPVTFTYDVYGLGFWRGYYRGFPIIGHSGSTYGYRALLTLIPSQKLGIFTALSGEDPSYRLRGSLHAYLMDQTLNQSAWLNASTLCSFPAPWHDVPNSNSGPVYNISKPLAFKKSAYVGRYSHPAYGTLEVTEWQNSHNQSADDGREPGAPFTLFYGVASYDLIPRPSASSPRGGDSLYGKGRDITAWVDNSPFVFHAPPSGSDVVMKISAEGFEKIAPVFVRVSGSSRFGCSVWCVCLCLVSFLVCFVLV